MSLWVRLTRSGQAAPTARTFGIIMKTIIQFTAVLMLLTTQAYSEGEPSFNVTTTDVTHTKIVYGISDKPILEIHLKDAAARRFADFTKTNLMRIVAIQIDGITVSLPKVREVITGASLDLKLDDPDKTLKLARQLTGTK